MSEFLQFDPVTGLSDSWDYNEMTGDIVIHRETDVEPLLKAMAETRATGSADKNFKRDMPVAYAFIDPVTELELMKKGIDIHRLGHPQGPTFKAFAKEIETNYPHLKATEKKAWRPQ